MPLDVLGRTRATLTKSASMSYAERCGESCETLSCWGLIFEILDHERGIPSKRKSAACVDYVPALCTHRPSLLPIELLSEVSGFAPPYWVEGVWLKRQRSVVGVADCPSRGVGLEGWAYSSQRPSDPPVYCSRIKPGVMRVNDIHDSNHWYLRDGE